MTDGLHNVGGGTVFAVFAGHEIHVRGGIVEEGAIAGAEIVQAGLSGGGLRKTVLRTFAMTGKKEGAFLALGRKRRGFHSRKFPLFFAIDQIHKRNGHDVAQPEGGKDKMVATIHITVPFHNSGMTTVPSHRANAWSDSAPVGQCSVEKLDIPLADIVSDPFVENGAEEVSPCLQRIGAAFPEPSRRMKGGASWLLLRAM